MGVRNEDKEGVGRPTGERLGWKKGTDNLRVSIPQRK